MATFLPGNTSHQDLGDQKPISYLGSAPSAHNSMMYLNQAPTGDFSDLLSGDSSSIQNNVQIRDPVVDQSFQSQGLSLSLATQIQSPAHIPSYQYQNQNYSSLLNNYLSFSGKGNNFDAESFSSNPQYSINQKGIHSSTYQYNPGFSSTVMNSKYLKAAQELLDEVVNVRKALKQTDYSKDMPSEHIEAVTDLSPAEKQDLKTKKSKLLSILDEVDRRYKQYYHQMKIVASSFDMVAGHGAAKAYTALALQTISQHFRCIRDAISNQIQITQRTLGEKDSASNGQGETIPRLRFVDHQLRQQRALQQLGVMRNAWRPQRGLPESSVSILRAWLFEHFLHPYPKDSEKVMLAKQTGLTRNQVANWFINARVRLWKPMIEEMYKEEYSELQANSNTSLENAAKPPREQHSSASEDAEDLQESTESRFVHAQQFNPNELNRSNVEGSDLYTGTFGDAMYDLPELNDFRVHRQVSLALELRRHENAGVDAGNQQERFGNSHVLHDFVV